ncbi:PAAR domain-containing protein [Sorangium sp. So ce834]|uniref:PAAR domain-containing protein n=1 Tax=Sorangium sp. So ce834 TaxID=3133321 RepID=UPI003F5FAB47
MTALEAARLGDSIAHSSAWSGLLTGAVAGVALAATVVAVVGTGGVAAVFIGAGIAAAGAGGGLAGAYIGELIPGDVKGTVATGSPDTFFGSERRSAVRAGLDIVTCADHGVVRVAQGSATTFVNGKPLARSTEKIECGAILREGIATVIIGGDTALAPGMAVADEVPPWVKTTLTVVMWGGAIVATGGAAAAVGLGAALAGFGGSVAGGAGLGWAGGEVGRHYGGELGARIGEVIGGTIGSVAGGMIGGLLGSRLSQQPAPPRRGYPGPSERSDAAMDRVFSAMEQAGVGKRKAVGVVVDRDGNVTVAVSGTEAQTQKIYSRIRPNLPPDYQYAGPADVPLQPARYPDGRWFPGGAECAEPKLSPALQRNPEGMTVRWWGDPANNRYPVEPGSLDMNPCYSCAHNEDLIVNGPAPSPPPPEGIMPPLVLSDLQDNQAEQ